MNRRLQALLYGLWWCCFLAGFPASAQELSTANTARYRGDGRWDWTVYIRAPSEVLKRINCVEYKLHPTFPDPVRKVCAMGDEQYAFALSSNGWGTFEIPITVFFKDSGVRYLRHTLSFTAPPVERPLNITTDNTARQVRPWWWEWTIFIQGPNEVLNQVQCVEYTLHPTFSVPVRSVCERGQSPQAFALQSSGWGTFTVGIQVFFRDGRRQRLEHHLKFSSAKTERKR
ncbi:MAG: hypothetical protein HY238_07525 [Acidobacteria bacterium]|nr:hypothetical protein [Acidobacteriota bacterium]